MSTHRNGNMIKPPVISVGVPHCYQFLGLLARITMNRLYSHVFGRNITPESQRGFHPGRGSAYVIFTARQIQEKYREQQQDLYVIFIDLTKVFSRIHRSGLWEVLKQIGCTEEFIHVIHAIHEGMMTEVLTAQLWQACVLASLLFSTYFAMALLVVAFQRCSIGVFYTVPYDDSILSLRRLQANSKVHCHIIRELLFADDCITGSN